MCVFNDHCYHKNNLENKFLLYNINLYILHILKANISTVWLQVSACLKREKLILEIGYSLVE